MQSDKADTGRQAFVWIAVLMTVMATVGLTLQHSSAQTRVVHETTSDGLEHWTVESASGLDPIQWTVSLS
jgi:hypothetical protein